MSYEVETLAGIALQSGHSLAISSNLVPCKHSAESETWLASLRLSMIVDRGLGGARMVHVWCMCLQWLRVTLILIQHVMSGLMLILIRLL